jgi:Lon protease-like protein
MIFLPFFPLNLVVYPHEDLNLHIFEPRYRQLINECLNSGKTFGIPAFVNNKLPGFGTEVSIINLSKRYEDGRMDVKTKGLRIFRIVTFENPVKGKLYAGGKANFEENESISTEINPFLESLVEKLYEILKVEVDYRIPISQPFSYRIAHKIGLSVMEEYELLTIPQENLRQILLIEHLERIIPVVSNVERSKDRIAMNGHFKNLDALNF